MKEITKKSIRIIFIIFAGIIMGAGIFFWDTYGRKQQRQLFGRLEDLTGRLSRAYSLTLTYRAPHPKAEPSEYAVDVYLEGRRIKDNQPVELLSATARPNAVIQFQTLHLRIPKDSRQNTLFSETLHIPVLFTVFLAGPKDVMQKELITFGEVPPLLRLRPKDDYFERKLWARLWDSVLDSDHQDTISIFNEKIIFPPGNLEDIITYTIILDHEGRLKVDYPYVSNIE